MQDKRQQIVTLMAKGKQLEDEAYALIPAGMGKRLEACPLELKDYQRLAHELDAVISTLKNNE